MLSIGTLIISDKWKAYVAGQNDEFNLSNNELLAGMHYSHQWVNHQQNFVDPITGAHTQSIESVWENRVKYNLKKMRGICKDLLPSYLDFYLWKTWFLPESATIEDTFRGFLLALRRRNQPEVFYI